MNKFMSQSHTGARFGRTDSESFNRQQYMCDENGAFLLWRNKLVSFKWIPSHNLCAAVSSPSLVLYPQMTCECDNTIATTGNRVLLGCRWIVKLNGWQFNRSSLQ